MQITVPIKLSSNQEQRKLIEYILESYISTVNHIVADFVDLGAADKRTSAKHFCGVA